jgi:hypothetical protein
LLFCIRGGGPGGRCGEPGGFGKVLGGAVGIAALFPNFGALGIGFAECRVEADRFVEVGDRLSSLPCPARAALLCLRLAVPGSRRLRPFNSTTRHAVTR